MSQIPRDEFARICAAFIDIKRNDVFFLAHEVLDEYERVHGVRIDEQIVAFAEIMRTSPNFYNLEKACYQQGSLSDDDRLLLQIDGREEKDLYDAEHQRRIASGLPVRARRGDHPQQRDPPADHPAERPVSVDRPEQPVRRTRRAPEDDQIVLPPQRRVRVHVDNTVGRYLVPDKHVLFEKAKENVRTAVNMLQNRVGPITGNIDIDFVPLPRLMEMSPQDLIERNNKLRQADVYMNCANLNLIRERGAVLYALRQQFRGNHGLADGAKMPEELSLQWAAFIQNYIGQSKDVVNKWIGFFIICCRFPAFVYCGLLLDEVMKNFGYFFTRIAEDINNINLFSFSTVQANVGISVQSAHSVDLPCPDSAKEISRFVRRTIEDSNRDLQGTIQYNPPDSNSGSMDIEDLAENATI